MTRMNDLEEHQLNRYSCVCKRPGERKRCLSLECIDHQACQKLHGNMKLMIFFSGQLNVARALC